MDDNDDTYKCVDCQTPRSVINNAGPTAVMPTNQGLESLIPFSQAVRTHLTDHMESQPTMEDFEDITTELQ